MLYYRLAYLICSSVLGRLPFYSDLTNRVDVFFSDLDVLSAEQYLVHYVVDTDKAGTEIH